MKEVFFMRHGLTIENELSIIVGSSDPSLSERGRQEIHSLKEHVVKPDIVLSSDLKRAYETAKILFPNIDVKAIPQLRERDFGVLEGKPIESSRKTGLMQSQDEETLRKNGVETPSSLLSRANQVASMISQMQAQKIVVVSHGTLINYVLKIMLPENARIEMLKHTHYHKIVLDSDEKVIDVIMNQSWLDNHPI